MLQRTTRNSDVEIRLKKKWRKDVAYSVTTEEDRAFVRRSVEAAVRIGLVVGLVVWCYYIVKPFVTPVLWAVILAVALFPVFKWLKSKFGGRGGLAAGVLTIVFLGILIVPIALLSTSTIESVQTVTQGVQDGTLAVPPPPDSVAEWPVVGEKLFLFWTQAADNLQKFFSRYRQQLRPVWAFVVGQAASAGAAALLFVISILIAGLLMAKADGAVAATTAVATRLVGEDGESMVNTAGATIRSVVQGVLGVAIIQSLLSGVGMLLVGVPGAGLWAGLILILAIMQLPPILVLGPVIVYVFTSASTVTAVIFLIFALVISASDAFLKPIFLGRGVAVPMPVILIGAIGGMMFSGIVGLFIGAVVLALGYQLATAWIGRDTHQEDDGGGETEPAPA
jgi:predicted PurR-regulated permease PerM